MIELLYRGEGGRQQRSFRSLAAARRWCRRQLSRPFEVISEFGYVVDGDNNHIVVLTGCTAEELA